MLDVFIYFLQLLATLITTLLGLAGMLYDFHIPDTKRLTPVGRKVLTGFVVSSVVSVVASGLDFYKKQQADQEAYAQTVRSIRSTDRLLRDINRTLHPLETVEGRLNVNLLDRPGRREVRDLKARLRQYAARPGSPSGEVAKNVFVEATPRGRLVRVNPGAAEYPTARTAPALHHALTGYSMGVSIFRPDNLKSRTFQVLADSSIIEFGAPDLSLLLEPESREQPLLMYWPETDELQVELDFKVSEKADWGTNGKLASTLDLPGMHLQLNPDIYNSRARTLAYQLQAVQLSFSGETYWLKPSQVQTGRVGTFTYHRAVLKPIVVKE
ncbi:hypothetical protein [Hymenobacter edaphi]|uniref:Uncharacterized protein n=1 Tax=Hymenobacter edaphi TaxID=2211146 RepID=A0A328BTP1_9BACT|nr:hypothetical protein [Hymenobacter edaphi]RAK69386.1 hypothetical protein DLM85_00540 [Hymenobacter edaphi]